MMNDTLILIPCYNPDEKLIALVKKLYDKKCKIVLVNDGSKSKDIFNSLNDFAKIISYDDNKGKGHALKVGFEYALKLNMNVVTADADGQHTLEDILKIKNMLKDSANTIVFGERCFDNDIPLRSKFGNKLTSKILKIVCNITLRDTQTGLRGYTADILKKMLSVNGERFEYEMNIILALNKLKINIKRTDISTIYIEENKSSHFRPIIDSLLVYKMFLPYIIPGIILIALDYISFLILLYAFKMNLFYAIFIPKVIFNFVYFIKNNYDAKTFYKSMVKYSILILFMVCLNFFLTSFLYSYMKLYIANLLAGIITYAIQIYLQRKIIY